MSVALRWYGDVNVAARGRTLHPWDTSVRSLANAPRFPQCALAATAHRLLLGVGMITLQFNSGKGVGCGGPMDNVSCTPPGRRHIVGWLRNRALKKLERLADARPTNIVAQLAFLRALGREHPEAALRRIDAMRIERGGMVSHYSEFTDAVAREYLRALVATGRVETAPLREVRSRLDGATCGRQQRLAVTHHGGASMASGATDAPGSAPLQVSVVAAGWRTQLWRTARAVLVAFVALSAFGALLDDRGLSSRLTGTSTAVHAAEASDKRFADVVGVDEAKAELEELVLYLRDPARFTRLGGQLPKGCLLAGPPGTGKTLLARAVAGEADVPFFYASGSEFEEMYVGVGARRVRDLFDAAKKRAPCIVFIDEIDAIGASRHLKEQQAMKMTLNQLLVEMDGFEQNAGVIVLGATNLPDALDPALLRPGRFDKHVAVSLPDVRGRRQLLELHAAKVPLAETVNLDAVARGTPGMSGADLKNLVNQAALKAAIDGARTVDAAALDFAKDKILMGAERPSAVLSAETLETTAYHESGHALVALKTDAADPVHKATIVPRGHALGMVQQLPDGDQTSLSYKQMLAKLDVAMGGRVAEELVFGKDAVTSGASADIYQATRLARNMVTKWGFAPSVGCVYAADKNLTAERTNANFDKEVQRLIEAAYQRATRLLTDHRDCLEIIATALLQRETLSGAELQQLLVDLDSKKNKEQRSDVGKSHSQF